MSKKEYEIEFHKDGTATITEVEPYEPMDYSTDPNPTFREKLGKKVRNMSKPIKILLVLLFNIYGFLYRFSGNRTTSVVVSVLQFLIGNPISLLSTLPLVLIPLGASSSLEATIVFCLPILFPFLILVLLWGVDLFSVVVKNEITFIADRKYKNYQG